MDKPTTLGYFQLLQGTDLVEATDQVPLKVKQARTGMDADA